MKTLSFACNLTEVKPICSPACDPNAVCLPENNCECVPPYGGNGINCTGMNWVCCIRLIVRCLSWIQMAYCRFYKYKRRGSLDSNSRRSHKNYIWNMATSNKAPGFLEKMLDFESKYYMSPI